MKKKKILLVVLCMLLVFSVTACGPKDGGDKEVIAPESKSYNTKLYFVNEEYIITGDEKLDMFKAPVEWKMTAADGKQYLDVIDRALRAVPKGSVKDTKGYLTMITDNIQFNDVTVKDKTAYVDMKSEGLSGGGSADEILLIKQIVETLTGSFSEVENVQFLVDGKKAESLMEHVDTTEPIGSDLGN